MARKHYNLPPLTTLTAFEAAARHRSFKLAAMELNVTPGAVSHQIKDLEGDLGVQLFERQHRSVELTTHGVMLFAVLERSFKRLSCDALAFAQIGRQQIRNHQCYHRGFIPLADAKALNILEGIRRDFHQSICIRRS